MTGLGASQLVALSEGYAEACRTADIQPATADARLLHDALHDADEALRILHEQFAGECFAQPDRHGRCTDCGRLIARRQPRAHKKGGCLFAPAMWVASALMPVPYIGKALWLLRRRARA